MSETTYRVTLTDGQTFHFAANLVEASAPIRACFHDTDDVTNWQGTPFQTADAQHRVKLAAKLVAVYFADGPDDCTDVDCVVEV